MTLKLRKIIMLLGDIAIFYSSLFISLSIRNQTIISGNVWAEHWPTFTVVFVLWIVALYIIDLYDLSYARNDKHFMVRVAIAGIVLTSIAVAYFYIVPNLRIAPKTILIIDIIITLLLLTGWRLLFNIRSQNTHIPIIAIGSSKAGKKLLLEIQAKPQWGYKIVALFDETTSPEFSPIPTITDLSQLPEMIKSTGAKIIVVDDELYTAENYINTLFAMHQPDIIIQSLSQFYETVAQKIPLNNITKAWFLKHITPHDHDIHDRLKRVFDICLALVLLLVTLPFYPIIILAIILTSKGPAFYRQKRLGYLGKPFMMIKFRTMINMAEKNGAQWAQKNDPRITSIGKFLRKTRLDELPQMMNILKGDMSFIGPRAERPEFVEQLEKELPFYRQRLLVKPGASGWAQVNYKYGASVQDALEKLQFDLYYIKNRNWYLDFSIVLKTIKIMSSFGGQ